MAKVILYSLKMTAEYTVYPLLSQLSRRCPLTFVCLLFSVSDVNYSLLLFKQSGVLDLSETASGEGSKSNHSTGSTLLFQACR